MPVHFVVQSRRCFVGLVRLLVVPAARAAADRIVYRALVLRKDCENSPRRRDFAKNARVLARKPIAWFTSTRRR